MPSETSFAKLYLYNDTTDKEKRFLEFRSNLCGLADNSNMNKIDTLLSSQNTSINNINSKLNQIFIDDASGNPLINATSLNLKNDTYFENVAGTYNATCTYNSALTSYTLTLVNTNIIITDNIFTLRFSAPNEYQEGSNFIFDGVTYIPTNPDFESGQIVLINFDKSTTKCYFSSGSGKGKASDISVEEIPNLGATNVQGALANLTTKVTANTNNIITLSETVSGITSGTTVVPKSNHAVSADSATNSTNSSQLEGKNLSYVMDYNNLTNKPQQGGLIVSSAAPDVTKTTVLWVDLGNNSILKYSDGTQWLPVGSVWK